MEKTEADNNIPKGMGWRVAVSIVAFFASIAGIIVWLFFYTENFNVYQNIAVIAVILLGFVAVMGATWAPWGMRQGSRWNKNRSGSKSSC
jgi:H+/Cl- antiporter ClcA